MQLDTWIKLYDEYYSSMRLKELENIEFEGERQMSKNNRSAREMLESINIPKRDDKGKLHYKKRSVVNVQ